MTVAAENLTEKINRIKYAIKETEENGEDPLHLQKELTRLLKELTELQPEGKKVLKG